MRKVCLSVVSRGDHVMTAARSYCINAVHFMVALLAGGITMCSFGSGVVI